MRKIKYSPLNRVEGWVHKNLASLFVFMFVFGLGFLAALGCSLEKDKPETELPPVELIVPTEVVTPTPVEEVDTADTLEYYFNVPLSYGLQDWIRVLCEENGVPMALVMAIIERESYFDADLISGTADYGLMQINACNHEAMVEMFKMLALAVVFIYLVMVAQFQSLLSPFIVMFTIPLAFTGGFMGLIVGNEEVSIIAMVGFVMLSGIIVNNGIVLVDYINQLRIAGMEKSQAIITAGKTRLRPILMTALTTILGLSTMAIGAGMGADMVQPMAVVTIGGLLYGTLLTLYVVPCVYDIFNRKKDMTTNDAELDDVDYISETIEHV